MEKYKSIVDEEQKYKAKLYTYPNWNKSTTVFDFEDLQDDAMLVLCVKAQHHLPGHELDQHKVFVWKGNEFDEEEANNEVINVNEFTQKVMEQYWGCRDPGGQFNIQMTNVLLGQECDEFYDFF